ncbi:MAG TPA: ABC transporter ATP-binding protein [Thermodesulfobacteriota bacterium]|jgi:putative ABC transport system ATP-binding protein
MDYVISLEDIHKVYNMGEVDVHALRGVSINIKSGEFISIIGPSGSGKSTLMNIIGCLDKPTSGNYFIEGQNIVNLEKDRLAEIRNEKIGFVFQSFNLLPRTSAIENVELPLIYNGTPSNKRLELANEALSVLGLEGRENHLPSQLSGGQQQRVAIARAIVNKPSIILADEPTGNLDTKMSIEILEIFKSLNDQGKTIIMITHEKDIADYAKRIVILSDGKIVSENKIDEKNKYDLNRPARIN